MRHDQLANNVGKKRGDRTSKHTHTTKHTYCVDRVESCAGGWTTTGHNYGHRRGTQQLLLAPALFIPRSRQTGRHTGRQTHRHTDRRDRQCTSPERNGGAKASQYLFVLSLSLQPDQRPKRMIEKEGKNQQEGKCNSTNSHIVHTTPRPTTQQT